AGHVNRPESLIGEIANRSIVGRPEWERGSISAREYSGRWAGERAHPELRRAIGSIGSEGESRPIGRDHSRSGEVADGNETHVFGRGDRRADDSGFDRTAPKQQISQQERKDEQGQCARDPETVSRAAGGEERSRQTGLGAAFGDPLELEEDV